MMRSVIKRHLFQTILFFACIIVLVFSLFISIVIYHIKIKDTYESIKQKTHIIAVSTNGLFVKIENYIDMLSHDPMIVDAESLTEAERAEVISVYRRLKDIDHDIQYIYSGYAHGALIIDNYTPPSGYDPRLRPWYQSAIRSDPNISTGIPYREIKTREWLISFSKVLKDEHGEVKGVLSIDVSLSRILKLLIISPLIKCFIINKQGRIIVHNNPQLLNTIYHRQYSSPNNKVTYEESIDNFHWYVIAQADKKKMFSPIIYQILICNLVVLILAMMIAWGLSFSFTKKFIHPIMHLKRRVEIIVDNGSINHKDYEYPDNEIGLIANSIENLTKKELYKKNRELKELSQKDDLTGLYNRRYMMEALSEEFERAKRYGRIFSIVLIDIDKFKEINDFFGHNVGDEILKGVASTLVGVVRKTDKVSRWGGEEFLILCPETRKKEAKVLAEKVRRSIEDHDFGIGRRVTISGGVAEYEDQLGIKNVIDLADQKLYEAKNAGRNRIRR